MAGAKNVVIRRDNPAQGQGMTRAISARTGWEYEHDETDEQIDALEELILTIRSESGASTENNGRDGDGCALRGATFSWNRDAEGVVHISTTYVEDGDGVVNVGGKLVTGKAWVSESWEIALDGTVKGA